AGQDLEALGDDFRADAITGHHCDLERGHGSDRSGAVSSFDWGSRVVGLAGFRGRGRARPHPRLVLMSTPPIRNARPPSLPATLSRTWLLVNARKPQALGPAQRSEADSVICDMEAAAPDDAKDGAPDNVVKSLSEIDPGSGEPQMTAWVRINDVKSKY